VVWFLIIPAVPNHPPAPSLDKEGERVKTRLTDDFALTVRFIRRGTPLWMPWLYVAATPPMEWASTETSCPYRFPRLSRGGG
jgi:hypothetical protein